MKIDWGTTSPNIRMTTVEIIAPIKPVEMSDTNIANIEFTATFVIRIEHKRKLPLFLRGRTAFAYLESYSSSLHSKGPFDISSKYLGSRLIAPRLSPDIMELNKMRTTCITICHHFIDSCSFVSDGVVSPKRVPLVVLV